MWGLSWNIFNKKKEPQMTLPQKALEIAITQIGQQEHPKGSNWGHPVQDYLASVGIFFPASWCVAVQYWCFNEAAKQLGVVNPMPKTGGVLDCYAKAKGKYIVVGDPQPGDVFIMDLGHGLGHMGMVELYDGTIKSVHTVDGNTNDTGSREGYEVCRKQRSLTKIKAFLRFV